MASSSTATPASLSTAPPPTVAFDEQVIADFEQYLEKDPKRVALTANKRSKYRIILDKDYKVSRKDMLNQNKPVTEWQNKRAKFYYVRGHFELDNKD